MQNNFTILPATPADVPMILDLIGQLAVYEKLEHMVTGTETCCTRRCSAHRPAANALRHEHVREIIRECLRVFRRAEITGLVAPLANAADDAPDQLLHAVLALRRTHVAAEIL